MEKILSDKMMKVLRQRRNLEPEDESQDEEILRMSPKKIVREMTGWHLGDTSWADQIAWWMVEVGAKPEDF